MAERYRLVIAAHYPEEDDPTYLELDVIGDRTVNANARIAEHPMQDGTVLGDHMYREPIDESFNGTFGLEGSGAAAENANGITVYKQHGGVDRLSQIQNTFEDIQKRGILCTLITFEKESLNTKLNTSGKTRFKIRNNMALRSISWTEALNTVKFSFNFREVMQVEPTTYETTYVPDPDLPNVFYPEVSSATELLFNISPEGNVELIRFIIETLVSQGALDKTQFANLGQKASETFGAMLGTSYLSTLGAALIAAGVVTGAIVKASILAAVGGTALTVTGVLAAIPVGGWIAIGVAAVGALIYIGLRARKQIKIAQIKKSRKNYFKLITNNNPNEQEINALNRFCNECAYQIAQSTGSFKTFSLSSGIDDNREKTLYINCYNIALKITMKYTPQHDNPWSAHVYYADNDQIELAASNSYITNFGDENNDSLYVWKDPGNQYYVYLANPTLSDELLQEGYSSWRTQQMQQRKGSEKTKDLVAELTMENYEKQVKQQLCGYMLVVSNGPIQKYMDEYVKIIVDTVDTFEK